MSCDEPTKVGDFIAYVSNYEIYHFDCRPTYGEVDESALQQDGYLFIDLETGGLSPDKSAIVQIAVIATDNNFLVKDTWSSLIKPLPGQELGDRSIEVHGLTAERLKNERDETEVIPEFIAWCEQYPNHRFAGQNCPFDDGFIRKCCKRLKIKWEKVCLFPAYDTLTIARRKLQDAVPNHQLSTLAGHFGFSADSAHDAMCDLFLTVQVGRALQGVAA